MPTELELERNRWRIQLLGGLKLRRGEESVERFRTRKSASLLAYLAFHRGSHSRESLIEFLWPEVEPESGRNNLRVMLSYLRARFEASDPSSAALSSPFLETSRLSISLSPTIKTDVEEFEAELRRSSKAFSVEERVQASENAVHLYSGPLLAGFYDGWIPLEAARLEAAYLHALHSLIAFYRGDGNQERVQHYEYLAHRYDGLTTASPAKATFTRQRRAHQSLKVAPAVTEPSSSEDSPLPSRLSLGMPVPLTRCFGRETEVARLQEMLGAPDQRLITLTGPGGVGKTRLALETAHLRRVGAETPFWANSQIFWLPLADVTEAQRVPEVLMSALRISVSDDGGAEPLERIVQTFLSFGKSGRILLILDNVEQLLPDAASLVRELLEHTPNLTILATSRRRLHVPGEHEFSVQPLVIPPAPHAQSQNASTPLSELSSLQLLIDRARLARPDWSFTARDMPTLAALVRKVEGFPLAIELIGARSGVLSPAQMLARLNENWDWVSSRKSEIPARHRSLSAAFAWSISLLAPEERLVFAQCSVFRGGWTLDDASAVLPARVSAPLLDALQELRDASLVTSYEDEGGQLRFTMLEVIRQSANETLTAEERSAIGHRHAVYYYDLALKAASSGGSIPERKSLAISERQNFSAALDFWMQHDLQRALQMASSLWWMWVMSSEFAEGRRRLRELLACPEAPQFPRAQAYAQNCAAYLAVSDGDIDEAEPLLNAALSYWEKSIQDGDTSIQNEMGSTFNLLGAVHLLRKDNLQARDFYARNVAIRREQNNPSGLAIALNALAAAEREAHNAEAARQLCNEALEIGRNLNDKGAISWALHTLGYLALDANNLKLARALQEESLTLRRENHQPPRIADCLEALGAIAAREGKNGRAREYFEEAIQLWRSTHRTRRVQETQRKINALSS